MSALKIGLDLDGTLLDSAFRHQKVLYDVLRDAGINTALKNLEDFVPYKRNGKTTKAYIQEKNLASDQDQIEVINHNWIDRIEHSSYLKLDNLFEDTMGNLSLLQNIAELFLVTARYNKEGVMRQILNTGIEKYFSGIFVVDPGGKSSNEKASATINLGILFIVGDTEADFEWSQMSDGSSFFALNRGFRSRNWWDAKGVRSWNSLNDVTREILNRIE